MQGGTHLGLGLERVLLVRLGERLQHRFLVLQLGILPFPLLGLGIGEKGAAKGRVAQYTAPPARTLVDAGAQLVHGVPLRMPQSTAQEAFPRLHMNVVARVGAFAASP